MGVSGIITFMTKHAVTLYSIKMSSYCQNDSYSGNVWYTKKDSVVYGIVLGWPEGDRVEVN